MKFKNSALDKALQDLADFIEDEFDEGVCSIALFGSVARNNFAGTSDIDIMIVHRISNYRQCWRSSRKRWEEMHLESLKEKNLPFFLSPLFLAEEELAENPLILLDVMDEGIILLDRHDTLKERLTILNGRLKELGAKKIYLDGGKWYWDLKPDWKTGEKIVL